MLPANPRGIRATFAIDTEWQSPPDERDAPEKVALDRQEGWNELLCYSACLRIGGEELSGVYHIADENSFDRRKRLTLRKLVAEALMDADARGLIGPSVRAIDLAVVFHFSVADIFGFRARRAKEHITSRCECIRGCYATIKMRHQLPRFDVRLPGRTVKVFLHVRDTMLLAPAGSRSLAALGEAIGLPKLDLPDGAIEKMREYRQKDPETFGAYALRDAVITARYYDEVRAFAVDVLGLDEGTEPLSLAGMATKAFTNDLADRQIDPQAMRGRKGRGINAAEIDGTGPIHDLATRAFHGGSNVSGWYGPTPPDMPIYDADLKSAYPTAQATIRTPGWEAARMSKNLVELAQCGERGMSFAEVRFAFPAGTRFPCLPVVLPKPDHALLFPLEGVSFATGPELLLARQMGASLEVLNGAIVPALNNDRPFVPFVGRMLATRARFKKAGQSLFECLAKEASNSVYGKTAQGLSGKRGFSIQANAHIDIPGSAITCSAVAAWTTGMIRAALGELLSRLPPDAVVVNWVTDGIASSVPAAGLDASGPIMTAYREARRIVETEILGKRVEHVDVLEDKHRAQRVLAGATRLCLTIAGIRDQPPISAKAGNRLDDENYAIVRAMKEEAAWLPPEEKAKRVLEAQWVENDTMLAVMRDRTPQTVLRRKLPEGLIDQYRRQLAGGAADLQWAQKLVRVAGDYDHKRRLVSPVESGWFDFAAWETVPWATAEDAIRARGLQKARRKGRGGGRVLKTMADAASWLEACRGAGLVDPMPGDLERPKLDEDDRNSSALGGRQQPLRLADVPPRRARPGGRLEHRSSPRSVGEARRRVQQEHAAPPQGKARSDRRRPGEDRQHRPDLRAGEGRGLTDEV